MAVLTRRSFIRGLIRCAPAIVVPSLIFDCKPKRDTKFYVKFYPTQGLRDPNLWCEPVEMTIFNETFENLEYGILDLTVPNHEYWAKALGLT